MKVVLRTALSVCAILGALVPSAVNAQLSGSYFKVKNDGTNHDFNCGPNGSGEVDTMLGPHGLPVVSPAWAGILTNVNGDNELQWWTPQGAVLAEKTQTDSVPIQQLFNFYPDGENSNSNFFRTVHWQGSFDLSSPGTVTLGLGSDDDSFLFVDGKLFVDNGGIHALQYQPHVTDPLTAGHHTVDLFFADRCQVQSGIDFTADIQLNPTTVPEPSAVALLFGVTSSGFALLMRRRVKRG